MRTTFIASGDSFITRHVAKDGYDGFDALCDLIGKYDVRFANLEMTFHRQEGYPSATSGGTWAMTDPTMLDDILRYGFNIFNTANNHSGDFGQGGVSATIRHLNERNMVFAGTGNTLQEASRACYLETREARVALIGVTATLDPAAIAGGQGGDMIGRPGLNPLRFKTVHHVNVEHFAMAKTLSDISQINARTEQKIRNGYLNPFPEGTLPLGNMNFLLTDDPEYNETSPNPKDLVRTVEEIKETRRQADVVLVSVHAHEMKGADSKVAAQFVETFARACIDAGASAVIGHGPHELRGIEVYNGGLIFYSLGNFIFQTETVATQPYDAFVGEICRLIPRLVPIWITVARTAPRDISFRRISGERFSRRGPLKTASSKMLLFTRLTLLRKAHALNGELRSCPDQHLPWSTSNGYLNLMARSLKFEMVLDT